MILYIVLGLVGAFLMLAGVVKEIVWIIPVGGLLVIGSFVWFARSQTSAPVEGSGKKP